MSSSAVLLTESVVRDVIPSLAVSASVDLNDPTATAAFDKLPLQVELEGAVARRRMQFRAGRHCARLALRAVLGADGPAAVGRGPAGQPIWPVGITGSITHTETRAAAVVARMADVGSIGIDVEAVMSLDRARDVARIVAWPSEVAVARTPGFGRDVALTLVFSAKEAYFKCLYPLIGVRFGFHDVRIVAVDGRAGTFDVRLVKALTADWRAGSVIQGRFAVADDHVHTCVAIQGKTVEASQW